MTIHFLRRQRIADVDYLPGATVFGLSAIAEAIACEGGGACRLTITGSLVAGQTLTATLLDGWAAGIQWVRNGVPIAGATDLRNNGTQSQYVVTAADVAVGVEIDVRLSRYCPGNPPGPVALSISGTPVTTATVGTAYAGFSAVAAGGTAPYTYSLASGALPAGLTVGTSTGAVSGTPTSAGTSSGIVIRVTDAAGATANLPAFAIVVTAAAAVLAITGAPATSATVGAAYNASFGASGGTAPYTFSLAAGTLPAGLSLNASTGAISGTPTTAGTSSGITVRVTDAAGATATAVAFAIVVSAAAAVLAITGTPATSATVGTAYTASFGASGGTAPYTFSLAAGTLPAGLSLNASTGAISGTPTTAGTSSGITVRVTDAASATATATAFAITVGAAALDTRPGWFAAPSTAATTGTATFVGTRTALTGSSNGGKSGTAVVTTTGTNYAWFAIANASAPTFTDVASGLTGGFTLIGQFVDVNNTTWYLYRSDYPASYTNGSVALS